MSESQERRILAHLQAGRTITAIEALNLYDCFRLGSRIYNLRQQGHNIRTVTIKSSDGKKRFARYYLTKPNEIHD